MTISIGSLKSSINDRLANTSISALESCQLQAANTIIMNVPVKKIDGASASLCNGLMVYCDGPTKGYFYGKGTVWASDTNSKGVESYPLFGVTSCNVSGNMGICSGVGLMWQTKIGTDDQWVETSSSTDHTLALKKDGSLWAWGWNSSGQLGDNTTVTKLVPTKEFCQDNSWCMISAGVSNSAAIKLDGSLWTWGLGSCGRLGNNSSANRAFPGRESTLSNNWCQVSVGFIHTAAIKTDGSLWSWGGEGSTYGAIGDNTTLPRSTPTREITSSNNWCQVSVGNCFSAAIKTDGTLWGWGWNCGQLGDNSIISKSSPVREISSSTNWYQVSTSYACSTHAIKKDGSLWSWGYNGVVNLGDGTSINRSSPVREATNSNNWSKVVAGALHVLGLKQDGTLWGWGWNCGQLFLGEKTYTNISIPTQEYSKSNNWVNISTGKTNATSAFSHAIKKVVQGYCV